MWVGEGRGSQAPPIPVKSESIDDPEAADDSEQVASKNVDNDMIPPAFFEVIEHIPQTVLYQLEGHRRKENELEVTTYQSFEEPA